MISNSSKSIALQKLRTILFTMGKMKRKEVYIVVFLEYVQMFVDASLPQSEFRLRGEGRLNNKRFREKKCRELFPIVLVALNHSWSTLEE